MEKIQVTLDDIGLMPLVVKRVERLRTEISEAITAKGLRASGRTQASMVIRQTDDRVIMTGRKAFHTLETGTPAIFPKMGFTYFRSIIERWAKDKGLNFDDKAIGGITYTILHSGTKTYRRGGRRDIYTQAIEACVNDVATMSGVRVLEFLQHFEKK